MDAVRELLSLGVPHKPRSTYGELPVDFAKEGGHTEVEKHLGKFLEILLKLHRLEFRIFCSPYQIDNYVPPQPTVYKYQWYHGTLDRSESNKILKEHATILARSAGDPDPNQTPEDLAKNQVSGTNKKFSFEPMNMRNIKLLLCQKEMDFSSGVFLIRYSENSGDDVLTLLYDYQPKHFIIQKYVSARCMISFWDFSSQFTHCCSFRSYTSTKVPICRHWNI